VSEALTQQRGLGRQFGWLWTAFAVSTVGTWLALDAFPLIAILVLHSPPTQVSLLAAAGTAAGALVALPLGPWVEFRRKRPVMIAMDLLRFTILLSLPVAYAFGRLTFVHLVVVSVIVAAANIGFNAAAGSCLRSLVRTEDLVTATGRFESTTWTATALGPPLGGAAIGIFGPLTTVLANAVSYLLSALAIHRIGGREPQPPARSSARLRPGDILDGWRYILAEPRLRPLFLNTVLVNALIMATAPLLAVLLLDDLGFAPWQYGLAFGGPCIGGLIGSRLARRLVTRFSPQPVLLVSGTFRACWSLGLVFVRSGPEGLALIMAIEFGLITCMGVFNPVFAAYRLEHTAPERTARTLTAWSITSSAVIAVTTVLGGILAAGTSPRFAIGLAGALLLATPVLLLRRR